MSNYKQNEMYADMAKNPSRKALEELRRKPYQAAGRKPTYKHKAEEDSEQQALIEGVELGKDYNLNVAPEDMEKYLEITAGADKPRGCI